LSMRRWSQSAAKAGHPALAADCDHRRMDKFGWQTYNRPVLRGLESVPDAL